MLHKVIKIKSCYNLDNEDILRKVTVKTALEIIDIQEEVTVEVLLDSRMMKLVISLEFVRKQKFKLKKIKRLIYVRNVNGSFKKEGPIEYMVEVNIYYQEYKVKIEINMIEG